MDLIIVESPAKAKTISKYLEGKYEVKASVGHIRDLPKSNKSAIDIEGGFIPYYVVPKEKEKIVGELQALVEKADKVYLATDPDREGEAIAWHIKEAIGLKKPKRVVFYEITKDAVKEAMEHPRAIDDDLRRAQEARRVLDRLVGYDLSGLVWKKVRYGLSAGRVQSPALRIIMEREREIRAFISEKFWVIQAEVKNKNNEVFVLTCVEEPREQKLVEKIIEAGKKGIWKVKDTSETEVKRSPKAPFITSTLQQAASSRLGFSPSRTMGIAQKLYEAGLITYMRTDSINLSKVALGQAYAVIDKKYGKEYLSPRTYAGKAMHAQEAHEAIRPTNFSNERAGTSDDQKKLYKLIWQRTIASQMSDAKLTRTKITAEVETEKEKTSIPDFAISGSRTVFPGWLRADTEANGEDVELPKVSVGEILKLIDLTSQEKETQPPARYTEAGLVKELEKRGIGRPSTYASILRTIEERGYVEKINKTLYPTDTGDVVSSFLEKYFSQYISDSFTSDMESKLDLIAEGKKEYKKTLADFYKPFSKDVKSKEKIEKITNLGEASPEFKCPVCGGAMIIKLGRAGKFLSCAKFPKCEGSRAIDGKTLEAPKETGEICPVCGESKDGKLVEREGKHGKFISCNRFPKCKYIKKDLELEKQNSTGIECPVCKKGFMTERRGRFGIFYSCSNYPECKYAIKTKPTGDVCKICGALMMQGTKTIPVRCSDKNCPNHNPHKINK